MRTLLIDADSLVYECAIANEYTHHWGDDLWTLHARLDPAIEQLDEKIAGLKETLEADEIVLTLSDYDRPWRKEIMPTYKANRKATRKPVIFQPMRDYCHEQYTTFQRQGLEGDDCLGVLATNPVLFPGEKIVVSLDKDMKTIPGKHYNMQKCIEFYRSAEDADHFHFTQILTGDSTDGYGGCPGVGPVSAEKILKPFYGFNGEDWEFNAEGAWQAIVKAYVKAGLNEEEAIRTARVARILRHGDYHYDKKEPILWEPPSSTPR